MAIKIGSDTLVTAYRGTDQLSKIYRGSTQIWPTTSVQTTWLTSGLNNILNESSAGQNVYSTSGLNIKLK